MSEIVDYIGRIRRGEISRTVNGRQVLAPIDEHGEPIESLLPWLSEATLLAIVRHGILTVEALTAIHNPTDLYRIGPRAVDDQEIPGPQRCAKGRPGRAQR